ncbi:MAG: hypothetical protein HRU20_01160 [Pseudomonadales bacterium]|nr:hypothetical protein [Pseudomonadales bacterium]
MKKLLIASSISTATLLSTTVLANDGEITIKGIYGDMRFEQEGPITSGYDEKKQDREGQASFELKYENDKYFIKGSQTRNDSFDVFSGSNATTGTDLNNEFKSRQTELEYGHKLFSDDVFTVSATTGIREYKTRLSNTVSSSVDPGFSLGDPLSTSSSDRWTEVFVGVQTDVNWLENNTFTVNYQHAINNGNSRKAFAENNYRFDFGLNLGVGYKWHDYEIGGNSGTTIDESGGYISLGYTF